MKVKAIIFPETGDRYAGNSICGFIMRSVQPIGMNISSDNKGVI